MTISLSNDWDINCMAQLCLRFQLHILVINEILDEYVMSEISIVAPWDAWDIYYWYITQLCRRYQLSIILLFEISNCITQCCLRYQLYHIMQFEISTVSHSADLDIKLYHTVLFEISQREVWNINFVKQWYLVISLFLAIDVKMSQWCVRYHCI